MTRTFLLRRRCWVPRILPSRNVLSRREVSWPSTGVFGPGNPTVRSGPLRPTLLPHHPPGPPPGTPGRWMGTGLPATDHLGHATQTVGTGAGGTLGASGHGSGWPVPVGQIGAAGGCFTTLAHVSTSH